MFVLAAPRGDIFTLVRTFQRESLMKGVSKLSEKGNVLGFSRAVEPIGYKRRFNMSDWLM